MSHNGQDGLTDALLLLFHTRSKPSASDRRSNFNLLGIFLECSTNSQVLRLKSGVSGDSRQHLGADLFIVVKSEDIIGPSLATECAMAAGFPFDVPADPE